MSRACARSSRDDVWRESIGAAARYYSSPTRPGALATSAGVGAVPRLGDAILTKEEGDPMETDRLTR